MLTLQVDIDRASIFHIADELNAIKEQINRGFTSGKGWEITGTPEDEDDECTHEVVEKGKCVGCGELTNE